MRRYLASEDASLLDLNSFETHPADYQAGLEKAMTTIIDDWGLRYPGVKKVEHVYFYTVSAVDDDTRRSYLEQAYRLGQEFAES